MRRGQEQHGQSADSPHDPPRIRRIPPRHILRSIGFTLKEDIWKNKQRLWTILIAFALVASLLAGIAFYWNQRTVEEEYVEIYVTDLPANFTRVDVLVSGVFVGAQNHSLHVERPAFDLLSLRGADGALRIASGYVPRENHSEVRIVFQSFHVVLNGVSMPLEVPDPVLLIGHTLGLGAGRGSAFLFDIDLDQSIVVTSAGLSFQPHVQAVLVHSYAGMQPASRDPLAPLNPFEGKGTQLEPPDRQDREERPPLGKPDQPTPSTSRPPSTSKFSWNPPPTSSQAPTTSPTNSSTPPPETPGSQSLPLPGDVNSIPGDDDGVGGWFARFLPDEEDQAAIVAIVESVGAEVIFLFGSENAAYIFATVNEAKALSEDPRVEYVEADQPVVLNLQSSLPAVRLPDVQNPLFGPRDGLGNPLDGRGVGVAVIDIGIDGTHPDLRHHLLSNNPAVLLNYKVESLFTIDLPSTDQTSGHGTHVAGILAGRGLADPTQRGVAYGAKLYGFGIGEASTTLWPNVALDWIVQNHDQVNPPIRIVSNSWGSGSSYDPNALTTRLVQRLVQAGVVVVFSAGNSGGDGSVAATTSQCQIPMEGVVCVAAYDDENLGTRDGRLPGYSSRGRLADPQTWPDLSAPGSSIRSASPMVGSNTGLTLLSPYKVLTGTSMATPHVSGAIALMLQMNPALSPATVERILEETAHPYASGGSYISSTDARYNGAHFAKGHGLLDVFAAVNQAAAASS